MQGVGRHAGALALAVIVASAAPAARAGGGFGLITEGPAWDLDRPLDLILRILGGIEIGGTYGWASVTSRAKDAASKSLEVASGDASDTRFSVNLYWAPGSTGFFIRPTAGYLSQSIDIADFRADLPLDAAPSSREIGGACANAESGEPFACDAPNRYHLELKSGFLGFRAGYGLVAGTDDVRLFSYAAGGASLVEFRSLRAEISDYHGTKDEWVFLRSLSLEGGVGILFPALHWSIRLACLWDVYFDFDFAQSLDFYGPVTYDPELMKYLRPLVRVEDARFASLGLQFSTALVF